MKQFKTIILGAGVTGLYLGKTLLQNGEKSVLILEKNDYVGGLCSSFNIDLNNEKYTLDYGPHKLFSLLPGIMEEFKSINGEDNLTVKKINSLFFLDKKFQFPIKPAELIKNINLKTTAAGIAIPLSLLKSIFIYNILRKKDDTFEDYLIKGFGKKAYNILFESYAWKVWADPHILSKEIAEIRIPVPNIKDLLSKTVDKKSQTAVNAKEFYYPKYGMQQLTGNIAHEFKKNNGKIHLKQNIISIDKKINKFIIRTNKETYSCERLISTIPLSLLINLYKKSTPEIKQITSKLKFNDLTLIHLFFNQPQIIKDNWIFFPELEYSFNRISEQKSFSPYTIPKDKTILCAEITNPKLNSLSDQELIDLAINDLIKANIISNNNTIFHKRILRIKNIYPIYDLNYKENITQIIEFLDAENIITIGRYGLFNYNNSDHCLDMAQKCAEHLLKNTSKEKWNEERNSFFKYKIVD